MKNVVRGVALTVFFRVRVREQQMHERQKRTFSFPKCDAMHDTQLEANHITTHTHKHTPGTQGTPRQPTTHAHTAAAPPCRRVHATDRGRSRRKKTSASKANLREDDSRARAPLGKPPQPVKPFACSLARSLASGVECRTRRPPALLPRGKSAA